MGKAMFNWSLLTIILLSLAGCMTPTKPLNRQPQINQIQKAGGCPTSGHCTYP